VKQVYAFLALLLTMGLILVACGPEVVDPVGGDPVDPLQPVDPVDPGVGMEEDPDFVVEISGDQQVTFGTNAAVDGQAQVQQIGGAHELVFTDASASVEVVVRVEGELTQGTYVVGDGTADVEVAVAGVSYNDALDGVVTIEVSPDGRVSGQFTANLLPDTVAASPITVFGSFNDLPAPFM
jgi:hypothetical protein